MWSSHIPSGLLVPSESLGSRGRLIGFPLLSFCPHAAYGSWSLRKGGRKAFHSFFLVRFVFRLLQHPRSKLRHFPTSGHSMEVEAYLGNKIKLDFFSLKKEITGGWLDLCRFISLGILFNLKLSVLFFFMFWSSVRSGAMSMLYLYCLKKASARSFHLRCRYGIGLIHKEIHIPVMRYRSCRQRRRAGSKSLV